MGIVALFFSSWNTAENPTAEFMPIDDGWGFQPFSSSGGFASADTSLEWGMPWRLQ